MDYSLGIVRLISSPPLSSMFNNLKVNTPGYILSTDDETTSVKVTNEGPRVCQLDTDLWQGIQYEDEGFFCWKKHPTHGFISGDSRLVMRRRSDQISGGEIGSRLMSSSVELQTFVPWGRQEGRELG